MEISAVQPVTPEPSSTPDDTAEWQAYAIGPAGAGRAAHPDVVESRFVFRRPVTAG